MRRLLAVLAVVVFAAAPAHAQTGAADEAVDLAAQATAICAAVVFEGQSFEAQFEGRAEWRSVSPSSTGSDLATHAWQHRSANQTFVMRLPNGGCSFGIDRADSEALRARIETALAPYATFELVLQSSTRDGRATRYGYCERREYPHVMSIVAARPGSEPNLVFNIFRAASPMPEFCVFR